MGTLAGDRVRAAAPAVANEVGLLSAEEMKEVLRAALGGMADDERLEAAVAGLRAAEAARWEQLPPEIHPDMGYHYRFLSCIETCWLGRQILIEGATFRIFRRREESALPA
jgi:hypothetical protein